jgi:hypothetical protein
MTKKERQTLFTILGIRPDTEEQAERAELRLETEAKRIKLWLLNANRPSGQVRDLPDVTLK